jgi:hypothetical protein
MISSAKHEYNMLNERTRGGGEHDGLGEEPLGLREGRKVPYYMCSLIQPPIQTSI